ncbi:G-rich sequence factor 1-like [Phaenicophaeus curvirostris]|uniref:G-rich sequence factor 1-like n=1 Tax=Phaenicophaeus curvirostris TaxID=33595 RepID=UPI0037F0FC05
MVLVCTERVCSCQELRGWEPVLCGPGGSISLGFSHVERGTLLLPRSSSFPSTRQAFFAPLKPTRLMVEYNSHGDATGAADVHFASCEDAVAAMAKEGAQLERSPVELFLNEHPKVKDDC